MFGGIGHLLNGNMFSGVYKDYLILCLGEENAERNDFAGIVRNKERYYGLCEGCGWITMDKDGKRVEEDEE